MSSVLPGYTYDIFISYRLKDNKGQRWVTEFVNALRTEMEASFKEDISIYFDENQDDGILETHHVDETVSAKIKCLVFIPIISQTYCDPKSFAWNQEFKAFVILAKADQFGLNVKVPNGNTACRVLPVRIHEIETQDKLAIETELGGVLRAIDFIYRSLGVMRPLLHHEEDPKANLNHTFYRDQVNKVGRGVKDLISGMQIPVKGIVAAKAPPSDPGTLRMGKRITRFWIGLIAAGLLALFIYYIMGAGSKMSVDNDRSIAVIPFKNLSGEKDQEYFSEGMMDEILDQLFKIKNLKVSSRTSSMLYRDSKLKTKEIAKELGVSNILEGSVQKSGGKIRIIAQLIDAGTDKHLWSQTFTRDMSDIFSIQSEISLSIAKALELKLSANEKNKLTSQITENIDAYDWYLKGKFYVNSEQESDIDSSVVYLSKAIALDPKFILAYTELSWAYGLKNFWFDPKGGWDEKAYVTAQNAIALDSMSAEAVFVRAFTIWTPKNHFPHANAIREYKRALKLNPNLHRAHTQLGLVYFHLSLMKEALKEATIGYKMDPYDGFSQITIPTIYYHSHRYKEALEGFEGLPDAYVGIPFRVGLRAIALCNLGRDEEARGLLLNKLEIRPKDPSLNGAWAVLLSKNGDKVNALKAIDIVENTKVKANHFHHIAYNIGVAYAILNEKEKSLYWLRWAAENGLPNYSFFRNDPLLGSLKEYPPFQTLLTELKVSEKKYELIANE